MVHTEITLVWRSIYYEKITEPIILRVELVRKVEGQCNAMAACTYKDLSPGVTSIINWVVPLELRLVERSVRWLLVHDYPFAFWGHLPPTENVNTEEYVVGGTPTNFVGLHSLWREAIHTPRVE